jgi:hypothetical protein
LLETPLIKFGKNRSARYETCDKPGPVTPCCGRDGGVHSMKPVYGAVTSGEPVTPDCGGGTATQGRSTGPLGRSRRFFVTVTGVFGRCHGLPTHWSGGLCHPGLQRVPQPKAAFGGPSATTCSPPCAGPDQGLRSGRGLLAGAGQGGLHIRHRKAIGTGEFGPVPWEFARGLARGRRSSPEPYLQTFDEGQVRPERPDFTHIESSKFRC